MRVRIGQETLDLMELLGEGAQGGVYANPDDPTQVVKVYARAADCDVRRFAAMFQRPPSPLYEKNGTPALAFPVALAHDPKTQSAIGFSMAKAAGSVPLQRVINPAQRIREIHAAWLLRVAKSFAMRIYALHWDDYVVGDIQLGNALVNRHAEVTLIDLDSLQFETQRGEHFKALYGIPSFQAPECLGQNFAYTPRTKQSDVFSLAIVVHMLLRGGEHPYNCHYRGHGKRPDLLTRMRAGYWPDSGRHNDFAPPRNAPPFSAFPKPLQELFRRTFAEGHGDPSARPTVTEFANCLQKLDRG